MISKNTENEVQEIETLEEFEDRLEATEIVEKKKFSLKDLSPKTKKVLKIVGTTAAGIGLAVVSYAIGKNVGGKTKASEMTNYDFDSDSDYSDNYEESNDNDSEPISGDES